jgi:hypothetical protein
VLKTKTTTLISYWRIGAYFFFKMCLFPTLKKEQKETEDFHDYDYYYYYFEAMQDVNRGADNCV